MNRYNFGKAPTGKTMKSTGAVIQRADVKDNLNEMKVLLELFKKFTVQWEALQALMNSGYNDSCSLMQKVQWMKCLDREKEKIEEDFKGLKAKATVVSAKMTNLCPTCKTVFDSVFEFIDRVEREGDLVRICDQFPQNKHKRIKPTEKIIQVDMSHEKMQSFKNKVS